MRLNLNADKTHELKKTNIKTKDFKEKYPQITSKKEWIEIFKRF